MYRFAQTCLKGLMLGSIILFNTLNAQATIITAPNVTLYNMPQQNSAIITKISAGTDVKIVMCNSAWCFIKNTNQQIWQEGWVQTNKLSSRLATATHQANTKMAMAKAKSKKASGNTAILNVSITIVAEDTQNDNEKSKILNNK